MESDYDYWWWNTTKTTKYISELSNHLNGIGI